MSYDISIFSSKPLDALIKEKLHNKFNTKSIANSLVLEKKNWQILIGESIKIEEDDIPLEISTHVIDGKYELNLILEPIGANKTAFSLLKKIILFLSKELNGIGYDGQLGQVISHNKYRTINLKPTVDKRIDLLTLTWWFESDFFEQKKDYQLFFELLKKYLKELIPKKYEAFNSPHCLMKEKGFEHFIDWMWVNNTNFSRMLYPQKPFYTLNIPTAKNEFYNRNGYCPKKLEIQVDSRILELEGWEGQLRKTWNKINNLIKPIYSDVRIIKNYLDKRSTVGVDNITETHPIHIGWKGIPNDLGKAIYLGNKYMMELGLKNNSYDTFNWNTKQTLNNDLIPNSYQVKRVRIKPDFEDFAFNRFKIYFAEDYPFRKPENYEVSP